MSCPEPARSAAQWRGARVVIAGVSTRAAAESAVGAGLVVTAIDAFGDLDQNPGVHALSLPRDFGTRFTPAAAARVAASIERDAVAYLSSFENHRRAVSMLAAGCALWGNAPAVLRRVRDPILVGEVLRRRGFPAPRVVVAGFNGTSNAAGPAVRLKPDTTPVSDHHHWLVKPLASGGGHGVRRWHGESRALGPARVTRLPRGRYLQELVDGTPGSVVLVAARGRAVPLGVSRQLVGEAEFGATGYRYCGSILAAAGDAQFARDEALLARVSDLVTAIAEEFGLVGVNGIDFIARGGVPYTVEVNPRWCASMELVERAYSLSVFGAHAAACAVGALPPFDLALARRGAPAVGKAVVFARLDVVVGDTRVWLEDESVRDVPHPGERIPVGRPVCTVFATGRDSVACHAALVRRAERVYAQLEAWARELQASVD